jgi:hypothetical protein
MVRRDIVAGLRGNGSIRSDRVHDPWRRSGRSDDRGLADVLGHQSLQTTGIYAKLDVETLAAVALPWGGDAS